MCIEEADNLGLGGYVDVASFLRTVCLPPVGAWLIERIYSFELDAPVVLEMLCYIRHVDRMLLQVPRLDVFGSVAGPGWVVIDCLPPHWAVAEEFDLFDNANINSEQYSWLTSIFYFGI